MRSSCRVAGLGVNRIGFCSFRFLSKIGQPINGIVKDRGQKDSEERDTQHAEEHGDTQGATHFEARTVRNNEWYDAQDECE